MSQQPTLYINVIEGKGLVDVPFRVRATMGSARAETQVLGRSLQWDEVIELQPDLGVVPGSILFECWGKEEKSIGEFNLDMKLLFNSSGEANELDSWFDLANGASIHIRAWFSASNQLLEYFEGLGSIPEKQSVGEFEPGLLCIDVMAAWDLPKGGNMFRFDMDPFVVVTLGETTFRTSTIKHNLNPQWKERLMFPMQREFLDYMVRLVVYDHDNFSNNDLVGKASIPVSDIMATQLSTGGEPRLYTLPLETKAKGSSRLVIRVEYNPAKKARLKFWSSLSTSYDIDQSGSMSRFEIRTMLDSLDLKVSSDALEKAFLKFNKIEELSFAELSEFLEENFKQLFIKKCPICGSDSSEDSITHIAICMSLDPTNINRVVVGNFSTEANAQRKWYTKILSCIGYGQYGLGAVSANILVQDRRSGEIIEEKMPTYIKLGIRLLYRIASPDSTQIRRILKSMSIKQGEKYTHPSSKNEIEPFINFHNLDRWEILDPIDSFENFNQFFYRKLRPDARRLENLDPRVAVSPADARVMVFPTIPAARELWIKGEKFNIATLFNNKLSQKECLAFEEGSLAIFRLAPQDYHRFHIPVDGHLSSPTNIDGQYYTVNPMAIRSSLDVYGQNKRVFSFIRSSHHGRVAMIHVGAMLVGSITLTSTPQTNVSRMDEHGYFSFGGSTILLLFEKNSIKFDTDLIRNSKRKVETLLRVGNSIGLAPKSNGDKKGF